MFKGLTKQSETEQLDKVLREGGDIRLEVYDKNGTKICGVRTRDTKTGMSFLNKTLVEKLNPNKLTSNFNDMQNG